MTNERMSLLAAICEEPDADDRRLVYADWLEENGEVSRAEFVRVQIAIHHSRCVFANPDEGPYDLDCNNSDCRHGMLIRRAADILHTEAISREMRQTPEWDWMGEGLRAAYDVAWQTADCGLPDSDLFSWRWRRGFIDQITLSLSWFLEHAGRIFVTCPIQQVKLTDRQPLALFDAYSESADAWRDWYAWSPAGVHWPNVEANHDEQRDELPKALYDLLVGRRLDANPFTVYEPSLDEAMADLSQACIRFGREEAKKFLLTWEKSAAASV